MQSYNDFFCNDCSNSFGCASELLKHFALHASLSLSEVIDKNNTKTKKFDAPVPDLYPIVNLKTCKNESIVPVCKEENADSGYEDLNPMKFCLVTMEDRLAIANDKSTEKNAKTVAKKYQCMYCSKNFGWCTDLKRHILIHTGERPFKCQHCNFSFTRNFLLQKHVKKYHPDNVSSPTSGKIKIPALRPIFFKHKTHKQDKCNVKKKSAKTKNLYPCKNNQYKVKSNLICTV